MIFDPYLEWLGLRTRRPVAGVHIASTHISLVALRRRPLRLVALGRRAVPDAAVVNGDIRLVEPLVDSLQLLLAETRIAPGTPTAAVLEPLTGTVSFDLDSRSDAVCDVPSRAYDQIVELVAGAGLTLRAVDVVPAALARLGALHAAPTVALDSADGWTVTVRDGHLDGRRAAGGDTQPTLRLGPEQGSTSPVAELPAFVVPGPLRAVLNPGRDSVAMGGALSLLRLSPSIAGRPATVPVGSGWTVQPVTGAGPIWPSREPHDSRPTQEKAKEE